MSSDGAKRARRTKPGTAEGDETVPGGLDGPRGLDGEASSLASPVQGQLPPAPADGGLSQLYLGAAPTEIGMVCRWCGSGPDTQREDRSVMSVLFDVHEADFTAGFMRFFTTKEVRELRLVHREFLEAVDVTPWHDLRTVISGPIVSWRSSFPNAQAANAEYYENLTNEDYTHFRGLRALSVEGCKLLPDAFVHLRGIEQLELRDCSTGDTGIKAKAFTHLKGVQELGMEGCDSALIAAAAEGIHGVRSFKVMYSSLFNGPIRTADVSECRRLIASQCLESSSWVYADVAFHGLPAPASAHDVIATPILELLQVGMEVGSAAIVEEATRYVGIAAESEPGNVALIALQAAPALVAALQTFWDDGDVILGACLAFRHIANLAAGQNACVAAGAVLPLLAVLGKHDTTYEIAYTLDAIANISRDSAAGAAAFVEAGAVSCIVTTYRKCELVHHCELSEIEYSCSDALRNLSSIPCGVEACFAADAVSLLNDLFEEFGRKEAKEALQQLGFLSFGEGDSQPEGD